MTLTTMKKRVAQIFPKAKVRAIIEHPTKNVLQMTMQGRTAVFEIEVTLPNK